MECLPTRQGHGPSWSIQSLRVIVGHEGSSLISGQAPGGIILWLLVSSGDTWKWGLVEEAGHRVVPLKDRGPPPPTCLWLSRFPGYHEVSTSVPLCHLLHDALQNHGSETTEQLPIDWNFQNCEPKEIFSPLKCFMSGQTNMPSNKLCWRLN